jgi:hypothetical protein
MQLLRKPREQGDPQKLEEFTSAKIELTQATQFFDRLRNLGSKRTGIPSENLRTHVEFCRETLKRADKHYQQARKEQVELEARRASQQKSLHVRALLLDCLQINCLSLQ